METVTGGQMLTALVVFVVATTAAYFVLRALDKRRPDHARRELLRGQDGDLVAVGERKRRASVALCGNGDYTSAAFVLDEGIYKAAYTFHVDVLTSVRLIHVDTGEDEVLFIKAGEGAAGFRVDAYGRYLFTVEPAAPEAAWTLDVTPLGMRGENGEEKGLRLED